MLLSLALFSTYVVWHPAIADQSHMARIYATVPFLVLHVGHSLRSSIIRRDFVLPHSSEYSHILQGSSMC